MLNSILKGGKGDFHVLPLNSGLDEADLTEEEIDAMLASEQIEVDEPASAPEDGDIVLGEMAYDD